MGEPLSSREASRNVTSASSLTNRTVTVMPGPTTPSVPGGPPTRAFSRMCWSVMIRASICPCSSLAAWYPPFSRRSPSSRAASIFFAISMRPGPERWSSSALSRSYASWVSQVTVSSRVSVTGHSLALRRTGMSAGPSSVLGGNLLRLTSVGYESDLVKCGILPSPVDGECRPGRRVFAPPRVFSRGRHLLRSQLRLMAVHAHPEDESSKGAATMARYVGEGAQVLVCTLTGGERGDILNPAMERPEVKADMARIRREEMARAREILGVQQSFLGFVEIGRA